VDNKGRPRRSRECRGRSLQVGVTSSGWNETGGSDPELLLDSRNERRVIGGGAGGDELCSEGTRWVAKLVGAIRCCFLDSLGNDDGIIAGLAHLALCSDESSYKLLVFGEVSSLLKSRERPPKSMSTIPGSMILTRTPMVARS
jgi:hypothetical protein